MALFQCRGRKNVRIYFWYPLPDLKHDQKDFIRIPSLKVQEMRLWALFSQFYQMVTMKTMTVTKLLISVWLRISEFYDCAKFHHHRVTGKKSYQ